MASFTVRMVLEGGKWEDYDELYENMERKGFVKTITADSGETCQLPDAEYNYIGDTTRNDVLDMARNAAEGVGLPYSILVTQAAGRTWYNLDRT